MRTLLISLLLLIAMTVQSQTVDETILVYGISIMKDMDATNRIKDGDLPGLICMELSSTDDLAAVKQSVRKIIGQSVFAEYIVPWKYSEEKEMWWCNYKVVDTSLYILYDENIKYLFFEWKSSTTKI